MFRHTQIAVLGTLMLMLSLAGCIQYQHIAPQDAQGQACVRQCSDTQQECHASRDQSYKEFKGLYDSQNQSYQNCLHFTEDPQLKQMCPQPTVPNSPDYSTCREVYDNCFVKCGGRIERVK